MLNAKCASVFCSILYLLLCLRIDVNAVELPETDCLHEIAIDPSFRCPSSFGAPGMDPASSTIEPALNATIATPKPAPTTTTTTTTPTTTTKTSEEDPQPPDYTDGDEDCGGSRRCREKTRECQDGFTMLASRKCYMLSVIKRTWPEALELCQKASATLAYPMNAVENTVLSAYLAEHVSGLKDWWLGGNDQAEEGQWLWAHNNASMKYFDWIPGEPDNDLETESCLQYLHDTWQWNDAHCDSAYPFVCQQL